jgi:hypothetical protein
LVQLPDGTKKLEQDMTVEDYENQMIALAKKHDALPSKNNSKGKK